MSRERVFSFFLLSFSFSSSSSSSSFSLVFAAVFSRLDEMARTDSLCSCSTSSLLRGRVSV